jgi:hypothetical protein
MTRIRFGTMVVLATTFFAACNEYGLEKACMELSPQACAQRQDCLTIDGRKGDIQRGCLANKVGVGCRERVKTCGNGGRFAISPEGDCYQFQDTCIPPGWNLPGEDGSCRPETFTGTLACKEPPDKGEICVEGDPSREDLTEEEAEAALGLLLEAYREDSDSKLVRFLDEWFENIGAIACTDFEDRAELEREAYHLFQAYYDPFHLMQYGENEWGTELYAAYAYIVVQDSLVVETANGERMDVASFRPLLHFEHARVLYLTERYRWVLRQFLDGELGHEEVRERFEFLERKLPVHPGHWSGWHIATHPEVGLVVFDQDLLGAKAYFRIVYEGGESRLEKEDDAWKLVESELTWIE